MIDILNTPDDSDPDLKTSSSNFRNTLDILVGGKVRVERLSRNLTQQKLGTVLCVTAERIQEFETGFAHIGARDLLQLARFFNVQPTVFFQYSTSEFANALEQAEGMTNQPHTDALSESCH